MTTRNRAGALLADLETLITELDGALADQNAARLVVSDAESELAIIEASLTLDIEGRNEQERRARLTLALREDGGYQQLAQTARSARAAIHNAERRITVIKAHIGRVRAALALLTSEGVS